jgi:hypothetical protein
MHVKIRCEILIVLSYQDIADHVDRMPLLKHTTSEWREALINEIERFVITAVYPVFVLYING